jgi:transposase
LARRDGSATAGTSAARAPGLADQRYDSAYLFAACRPGADQAFALALPRATTEAMALFLRAFAQQLAPGGHAILLLDRAGWPLTPKLKVPDNVTLLPLPPCSPELNPVERVWLYLRERFLSHRMLRDYAAVLDAACEAWNRLLREPGRLASLTSLASLVTAISILA